MDDLVTFAQLIDQLNRSISQYNSTYHSQTLINTIAEIRKKLETLLPKIYEGTGKANRKKCAKMTIEEAQINKVCILQLFMSDLHEKINNSHMILDDEQFIENFYNFVWVFWKYFGYYTMNISDFLNDFVQHINMITRENYVIIKCPQKPNRPNSQVNETAYICGRAMLYDLTPNRNTRLIVFNTIASNNMEMDMDYYFEEIYPTL